jgi:hypothetical protein
MAAQWLAAEPGQARNCGKGSTECNDSQDDPSTISHRLPPSSHSLTAGVCWHTVRCARRDSRGQPAKNPLGETSLWVMKTFLQRD